MSEYQVMYHSLFDMQSDLIQKMKNITAELVRAQRLVEGGADDVNVDDGHFYGFDELGERSLATIEACRSACMALSKGAGRKLLSYKEVF